MCYVSRDVTSVVVWFVEGEEERVGHAFGGEVGARTVARDDCDGRMAGVGGGGVVKREEAGEDAVHELIVVAAGMIGTADGSCEQGVTAEEYPLGRFVVADAATGMARGEDHLEAQGADFYGRAIPSRNHSRIPSWNYCAIVGRHSSGALSSPGSCERSVRQRKPVCLADVWVGVFESI